MKDERTERDIAMDLLHKRKDTPEVQAILRWSASVLEDAKDRLVTCEPHTVAGYQARAKLMRELRSSITNGPARSPAHLNAHQR